MAYDKVIDSAKLDAAMTATANAIRSKNGKTDKIAWDESTGFKNAVDEITAKADPVLQEKTVTPTKADQNITPDSGYDGLAKVLVKGDDDFIAANIKSGVSIFGVLGTLASGAKVVTGTVTVNMQNPYEEDRVIRLYDIGINPKMVMFYMPDMIPSTTRQYFVIAMIADTKTEECIAIRRNKTGGEISSYLGAVWCEADGKTTNIWCGEVADEEVHCYASTYNYIAFV